MGLDGRIVNKLADEPELPHQLFDLHWVQEDGAGRAVQQRQKMKLVSKAEPPEPVSDPLGQPQPAVVGPVLVAAEHVNRLVVGIARRMESVPPLGCHRSSAWQS